jgi:hypothetical protein
MNNLRKIVQVSLLLIVAFATTATFVRPAFAKTPPARTAALHPLLTPAVPVVSSVLLSDDSIRNSRQPSSNPHLWFWPVCAVGVITLILFGRWRRQRLQHREVVKVQPHETALQYLQDACRLRDPGHTRDYCYEVSRIVRRYIEERFGINKTLLPTEDFLDELTMSATALPASCRRLLAAFVEHYQHARSTGWYYCQLDLEVMHLTAVEFINQAASATPVGAPGRVAVSDRTIDLPPHEFRYEARKQTFGHAP